MVVYMDTIVMTAEVIEESSETEIDIAELYSTCARVCYEGVFQHVKMETDCPCSPFHVNIMAR